jgi:ketopantoate hydroxymethyltransferase
MKKSEKEVTWLTSCDIPTSQFAEKVGIDMLLVGGSMGMGVYKYAGGHCRSPWTNASFTVMLFGAEHLTPL